MRLRVIIGLLAVGVVLTACGAGANPTSDEKPLISPGGKGAKGGGGGAAVEPQ